MVKSMMALAVLVVVIVTSSCNSNKKGVPYPEQVRTNFVNGCASKLPPQYKQNCECMLQKIEQQYSLTEYSKIESDIKAGKDVSAFFAFADSTRKICFPNLK